MCRPAVSAQPSDRPLIQMTKEQLLNELDWILANKNIFEDKKKREIRATKERISCRDRRRAAILDCS